MLARALSWPMAFLVLASCAPPPVTCGRGVSFIAKSFFDGVWDHSVELETLEGPDLALPIAVELGETRLVFAEDFLYGIEGREVATVFRVSSHFDVSETGGACGPSIRVNDGVTPWAQRAFARIDWSSELSGEPLQALLPDAAIEPISFFLDLDDVERDQPHFEPGDDLNPSEWEVTSHYAVHPPACTDASCQTVIRARHRWVKR
jgi:hypothetical protein